MGFRLGSGRLFGLDHVLPRPRLHYVVLGVPGGSLLYSIYTERLGLREPVDLEGCGPLWGCELLRAVGREWTRQGHSGEKRRAQH